MSYIEGVAKLHAARMLVGDAIPQNFSSYDLAYPKVFLDEMRGVEMRGRKKGLKLLTSMFAHTDREWILRTDQKVTSHFV